MGAASRLVLIRHAAIECGPPEDPLLCGAHDVGLSGKGREQVERLRELLARDQASAVYSSPLRRARQTAEAAPTRLRDRIRITRALAEIDCGRVEGLPIRLIRERYPDIWARNEAQDDDRFAWPGGETYANFRRRVLRAIGCIAHMHPAKRVLIFTHAGVVNQVLGTLAGQSAARWENFRPANATLTEVDWRCELTRASMRPRA